MINLIAFVASLNVIIAYVLVTRGHSLLLLHIGNFIAGPPIVVTEIIGHAYSPMILTIFFFLAGFYGLLKTLKNRPKIAKNPDF